MADKRVAARALAEAFLSAPGTPRDLADRGARVFGERPAWLAGLARRFAKAGIVDLEDGVTLVLRSRRFKAAAYTLTIRTWVLREPVFGERGRLFDAPPIATTGDLAAWLGLTVGQLLGFADLENRADRATLPARVHYTSAWLARPGAAPRLIEAPKPKLAAAQRAILRGILDGVPPHDAAHGFVAGRSARSFAALHAGKHAVLKLDLEGFFGSITAARVTAIFAALGYPREIARLLAGLCTTCARRATIAAAPPPDVASAVAPRHRALLRARERHLPQGSPTSPALANLAAFGLDTRLAAFAREAGFTYARYADDLAFSGDAELARRTPAVVALCAGVAAGEGFALHPRKTRLMRRGARQRLVGLVVNAAPAVSRRERDMLEAEVHRASVRGPSAAALALHDDYRAHLRGRIAWVEAANPAHATKMLRLFAAIRWP